MILGAPFIEAAPGTDKWAHELLGMARWTALLGGTIRRPIEHSAWPDEIKGRYKHNAALEVYLGKLP